MEKGIENQLELRFPTSAGIDITGLY